MSLLVCAELYVDSSGTMAASSMLWAALGMYLADSILEEGDGGTSYCRRWNYVLVSGKFRNLFTVAESSEVLSL